MPEQIEQIEPAQTDGHVDLDQLDAILAGEDEPETAQEAEPEVEETQEQEAAEPDEETQSESIDYTAEIPMPDGGDAISLGDLKDRYVEYQRKEASFIERENELMRQRDVLSSAMQSGKVEMTPELQQQMAEQQQQHLAREHEAMLAALPEMADKTGFSKVRESVQRVFEQYGAASEVDKIIDHRLIKMAYDLDRYQQREKQAAEMKPVPKAKKPIGQGKPKARTANQRHNDVKMSKSMDTKLAYIDQLLEG